MFLDKLRDGVSRCGCRMNVRNVRYHPRKEGEHEPEAGPYRRNDAEPEPPDATRVRWLELPPTLAPYVRLGMRYYDGERQVIFRIIRELGEPEGYAEAIGTTAPMRELAETILDLCNFLDSYAYGVTTPPAHTERG